MSIEVDWASLTGGSDGEALAESVRNFIHDKFQQVPLPRFIRSVQVRAFDFGKVGPRIEIKDISDPLPEFYEDDDDDDGTENGDEQLHKAPHSDVTSFDRIGPSISSIDPHAKHRGDDGHRMDTKTSNPFDQHARSHGTRPGYTPAANEPIPNTPFLSRAPTPGILGGASNLSYFHMPFSAGTTTPLAAVAGAQFHHGRADAQHQHDFRPVSGRHPSSVGSSPPSTADPSSRPPSQHMQSHSRSASRFGSPDAEFPSKADLHPAEDDGAALQEPSPNDLQVVSHVQYAGDVRLVLTASILLDYPMPSFVEIPVKLNITGITFDGISILAYIRKKAHFCFLSPEDAESLLGTNDLPLEPPGQAVARRHVAGGLLEQIKVESEIGQKESGKQVLKNVGKVEKFILDQVRRIFEEEFVYPSFWTFLV